MYKLAEHASEHATEIPCKHGRYLKWSSPEGPELWLLVNTDNNVIGMIPSFSGKSKFLTSITGLVNLANDTAFEGCIHGWANPTDEDPESGDYPFLFELINKGEYDELEYPFTSEISLSAFAHEIHIYSSESEFNSHKTEEPKFAAESFIPSGLFVEDDGEPAPYAIFTGRVIESSVQTNPLTHQTYHWALVKTLGGEIDVLIDNTLVDKPIIEGGILTGSFWMNGKILTPKPAKKKNIFNVIFGGKSNK
ncbi:hypothetical protein ACFOEK_03260 [Litoribrevibacter euphylliae]|uniref:Uncharacterized protein n=1 Tax=Litoribrevibacter euphylliae TaxID=1834034 RepID=A0ABV7HD31_9GAMM